MPLWTAVSDRPIILLRLPAVSTYKDMDITLWRLIVLLELWEARIAPSAR